ncbi:hypothetical protein Tdes44962_MAKER02113 [Teratosphaeria destructans]|uniref:Uncharacterized protein n=1 Tax=Teratosphaeria destructans TaxID=418781 RepID=A0A9W7SVA5_9PEZI|nr:hypothetical protein Tdes44962_MAKER02113 [Teratosphaeria destructans]
MMKAILVLLLAATPALCVPNAYEKVWWCNRGVDGNGACEDMLGDYYTFCCIYDYTGRGEYKYHKFTGYVFQAYSKTGEQGCGAKVDNKYEGTRKCCL